MNKKAQAQIITTVLIILLVLAAIVIVWQVVNTTVKESTEQIEGGTDCVTIGLEIQDVDVTATATSFKVKRSAGAGDLNTIVVVIDGVVQDTEIPASELAELGTTDFETYPVEAAEKIEIAAKLGPNNNNKLCQTADTHTV